MAMMKDIREKFLDAFPDSCPRCQAELADFIDFEKLDEFLDLVVQLINEPTTAEKEGWLKAGYKIGKQANTAERWASYESQGITLGEFIQKERGVKAK